MWERFDYMHKAKSLLQIAATLNKAEVNSTAYFLAEMHTALAALDSTVGQTVSLLLPALPTNRI